MPKQPRQPKTASLRPPKQLGLELAVIDRPTFRPSRYQEDIFHFCVAGKGDGLIVAAAGAGKTATLIEAAQLLQSHKTLFLAFNRSIADELRQRLHDDEIDVLTIHGLGYRTLQKAWGDAIIDKRKYRQLARRWLDARYTHARRPADEGLRSKELHVIPAELLNDWYTALEAVANYARLTLTEPADAMGACASLRRSCQRHVDIWSRGCAERGRAHR
jgi:hypothetical protein